MPDSRVFRGKTSTCRKRVCVDVWKCVRFRAFFKGENDNTHISSHDFGTPATTPTSHTQSELFKDSTHTELKRPKGQQHRLFMAETAEGPNVP